MGANIQLVQWLACRQQRRQWRSPVHASLMEDDFRRKQTSSHRENARQALRKARNDESQQRLPAIADPEPFATDNKELQNAAIKAVKAQSEMSNQRDLSVSLSHPCLMLTTQTWNLACSTQEHMESFAKTNAVVHLLLPDAYAQKCRHSYLRSLKHRKAIVIMPPVDKKKWRRTAVKPLILRFSPLNLHTVSFQRAHRCRAHLTTL